MGKEILFNLVSIIPVAILSGMVGVFALMRRMSLAADAMSHLALPGLGLAFLYKIHPLIGGMATLFLGTFIIWKIEGKSRLPTDAVIGVIFSFSLALGSLLTPQEDILEALFGSSEFFSFKWGMMFSILLTILVIGILLKLKNKFIIQMIAPDLAAVSRLNNRNLNLYFLLIFALTILLGLRFLGALLTGALIIIPAAAAKNFAWNIHFFLGGAALVALLSVSFGVFLSNYYFLPLGPSIVVIAGLIFLFSLLWARNK
jgi:ABC-type Mn2+/Zn2+ transport system permease subunit